MKSKGCCCPWIFGMVTDVRSTRGVGVTRVTRRIRSRVRAKGGKAGTCVQAPRGRRRRRAGHSPRSRRQNKFSLPLFYTAPGKTLSDLFRQTCISRRAEKANRKRQRQMRMCVCAAGKQGNATRFSQWPSRNSRTVRVSMQ